MFFRLEDPLTLSYDAIVVGSGRHRRMGRQTAVGSRPERGAAGSGAQHFSPRIHRAHAGVQTEIPQYRGAGDWRKRRPVQNQCYACTEYNYDWFVDDLENPYSTPKDKPFTWQRLRIVGGRTLVWGRQSYRLSDLDFKAASLDGYGEDWPISYKDLAPFYDIVEDYVGISGAAEGNAALPDGRFLPPMKMTCGESAFARARAKTVRTNGDHRPYGDPDRATTTAAPPATTADLRARLQSHSRISAARSRRSKMR